MKTAFLILALFCLALLLACSGGTSSGSSGSPSTPSLASLQVTPSSMSIAPGGTQQFKATGKFSDGSTKDITSSVQWSSSDSNIASVTAGLATGKGIGSATITAQSGSVWKYSGNRNSQSNEYSALLGLPSGNAGYGLNCRRGDPAICCNGKLFRRKHPRPDRLSTVEFVRLERRISQRSRLGHGRGSRCGDRDGSIWKYSGNRNSQSHE